ncbi:hypothetical protein Tco_1195830 [Tanacetum coccineum]
MVGTLMYLTASRPYLTFVVCIVPAYADADHTGCQDTRRSTSGKVPAIYMQEFWATVTVHKSSIRFKINKKKFSFNVEVFREILRICPKIPGQRFEEPPLEHDILSFLRDLGHTIDIHYITDDQSISRRNKMFWHTTRDDTMFTSMRCVSRHEKTQVYGAILPQHLTNQAMLESDSLQTYYAYATVERRPQKKRLKNFQKKASPTHLPKKKTAPCYKVKLATRKHEDFHMSQPSGSGDGVDIQLKLPDEQQQKVTGTNEGAGVRPKVLDVPNDDSESEEEYWTFSQDDDDLEEKTVNRIDDNDQEEKDKKADDKEVFSNQSMSTPPDYELTDEKENKEGDDMDNKGEQEQDEEDDMYGDVNINLERSDAKMTDAQANKDTEDAHVTLTAEPPVVQQPSSSVSSDLVSKFINPSLDIEIPNFASVFRFDQRVSALETEMSEFNQTNQFVQVVSSIPGIVDNYLASKMKKALDVAIQLQSNKLREEAQAENKNSSIK